MELEGHLHVEVGRLAVDLAPEFLGDPPLVVEDVSAPEFHAFTIQLGSRPPRSPAGRPDIVTTRC